ncbi:pyridoxamine 5'-phosphate oxidase family protein [Noviherbaspirillum saxi]|uniref:Flavin-nucleotide-binding protein n=1 Tax=Noviherbaspirillum saxi TaxID=2320863 RepID=A0A3A3FM67_9BURK|nr:pyridoxamine 5'-phosphate oxidase family protein [Noviherbaspirillum saxi]RJF97272.1 flavin-nucleotide-binding protein [Noviherbaspirillum saxi]
MDAKHLPQVGTRQPFHQGEMAAQERVGVRTQMEKAGATVLRDYMPDQHRQLFSVLPTLLLGGADASGSAWASIVWGKPGFITSPDPTTLRIRATLHRDDPLAPSLKPGTQFGALGLQFETRRRNRANGFIAEVDDEGFTFAVQQSFGNCPRYIQSRELVEGDDAAMEHGNALAGTGTLPDEAMALIRRSDTFFIATAAEASAGMAHGADVSHRGGKPGFVHVDANGVVTWPDFAGNNFFNTVGNLIADGRAGLLFIDFEQGHLLQLSGQAEVIWEQEQAAQFAGAVRLLRFRAERYILHRGIFPMRWSLREQSPYLEPTGTWREVGPGGA